MRTLILLFTLLFVNMGVCFPQQPDNKALLALYEDSLKTIAPKIISEKTDSARQAANSKVTTWMELVMKLPESYTYPFDSLKTIAHMHAPDKRFRIYNWILPARDGTYKFFGYIQQYDKKKKKVTVFNLKDQSDKIEKAEKVQLLPEKWYGALYYKILMNKFLGKRYYTLLGWKGYTNRSNKKVIDVLHFSGSKPKFGYAFFKLKKETKHRVIFQYSIQAVMSLRYDESAKSIVYDHLSPSNENLKGQYEFYGPDFTYEALRFKRGKWLLTERFEAKNDKDPVYKKPRKQPVHPIPIKKDTTGGRGLMRPPKDF